MKNNNRSGFSLKSIVILILICAIGFVYFREDIEAKIEERRFEQASILLDGTYKNIERLRKRDNIIPPEYIYIDYRDETYYKENLALLLNYKQYNEKTGFGKKVGIRHIPNSAKNEIIIYQEFKDGSRVFSRNGRVLKDIYRPSHGAAYYGEEYLYKLNGK